MAQLWGGRFEEGTDWAAWHFNASIGFDIRLLPFDIEASIAHAKMLQKQEIIPGEEAEHIIAGLRQIAADVEVGSLQPDVQTDEDVHSFVERVLTERIGDAGKKLHTGRSRNDQVATDMRLYVRASLDSIFKNLYELLSTLHDLMKAHTGTYCPGFTHLQKAQPVTLAHHLGAYFAMFARDADRVKDVRRRMNVSPLGSAALAGTTYGIDRMYTSALLQFDRPCDNSMDGVSDRDYLAESLFTLSLVMMHLSRFSEELILWNSDEYRFVTISDAYSTGSSIMPQKKNPDIAELTRGKTGRVYGSLMALLTTMKSLPLAYNKDMQEDKETAFDAFDTADHCLRLFTAMLRDVTFHKERMEESAKSGFTNATDLADYLVTKGMAFRDAHEVTGRIVLACIDRKCTIEDVSMDELKTYSELFDQDVYDAISLSSCVDRRISYGGPSQNAMEEVLKEHETLLAEFKGVINE